VDDLTASIDSLDKLIADAPSSWFLRNRVRLNRKETKTLVDRIGEAVDARRALGAEEQTPDAGQTLVAEAFKTLAFEVKHGGGGGAAYQMRYLDISRERMSAMVGTLRKAAEIAARPRTSSGPT
jgi:hypothetical protein